MNLEEAKAKTKSFFKKVLWISLISAILFGAIWYFYRTYTVSEGTRSGMLFKISKKGKIFKTQSPSDKVKSSAFIALRFKATRKL